ncbi:MAG: TrkA family potassium uptake protein [Haloarculaceae archaeon]
MSRDRRIIIAGGGRAGLETAERLAERGHTVVIIEADEDRVAEIADEYVAMVIHGDATRPSILEQADVEAADAVAGLTDDAATNLAVCMEAHRIAPDVQTLARTATRDEAEYTDIVDAIILPQQEAADTAADLLSGEAVRTVVTGPDLNVLEIEVGEGAPFAGRALAEVALPEGALVVSDAGRTQVPSGETKLEAGSRYLVAVESDVADEVRKLFRG